MIPDVKPSSIKAAAQHYGVPEHIVAAVHEVDGGKGSPSATARSLSQYKARGVTGMLSAHHAGPASGPQPKYVASVMTSNPVVKFFESKGFTPAQAAGIAGNTMQESSNNPNAPGGGLFQDIGGRGAGQGASEQAQLQQAYKELLGPEHGALEALRGAKTPREAARVFSEKFERPGEPMLANRERYAEEAFGGKGGGPALPGLASSSPQNVRAVVAQAMGLPRGVTTQAGGTEVVPNPKAAGLQMLANEERGSDPILAQLLEAKAGEGTLRGLPPGVAAKAGVASTAAGIPTTGSEAQALVQAPPNLSKPAKAPVHTNLPAARKKYGVGKGGSFAIPKPGETSKGLEADLEPVPHVVAQHPSGTVVRHPSGVPLYIPNQRKGKR